MTPVDLFTGGYNGVWLDPSDFSTLFQDTAGTTAVTTTGQPVRKILDKSGNGNHVTFSGTNPPTLERIGTGGYYLQPVDSTSRGICSGLSISQPVTSCSYVNLALTSNGVIYDSYVDNGGMSALETSAGNIVIGSLLVAKTMAASAGDKVLTLLHNGTSSVIKANGVTGTTGDAGSNGLNGLSLFNICGSPNPVVGGYHFTGRFYGMVLINRTLTTQEKTDTENWMLSRNLADYQNKYLISGDSTVAAYLGYNAVSSYLVTSYTVHDIAVPGDTIADQESDFNALTFFDYAKFNKVFVQVGLNNITSASASTTIAALQSYIDNIRGKIQPQAKIIVSQLTPAKQRWIDIDGATQGAIDQQRWVDINDAIAGNGGTPITGVDFRATAHTAQLSDNGNLAAAYDHGDHIHENNAGRQIIAASWQDAFTFTGTGSLTGGGATLAGTASVSITSSGTLTGDGATLSGTASNTAPGSGHNSSGDLTGGGATLSGTASNTAFFSSTGNISGAGAVLSGTADNINIGSYSSSGDLVGGGATISGTASTSSGTTTLTQGDIDAIANAVWSHSSAVLIEQQLLEAWGRLGLDPSAPLITGHHSITFGSIVMAMVEASGHITVTRQ